MYSTKTSFHFSLEKNGHYLEGDYELDHVRVLAEARDEFWRKRGMNFGGSAGK